MLESVYFRYIFGSPCMFCGGGWHCTYSCLHRSHNTHWLTAHSPPMLTNTQACQKILKTHIFINHLYQSVYIALCVLFLTDLITILHFNSCYMLHLWITASYTNWTAFQAFKLTVLNWEKSFGNCVWCWKWRLCGNVFLPYSNDRLTLPFTQIWFDMLKLGPCPSPATANSQTRTNFTIFQIKNL